MGRISQVLFTLLLNSAWQIAGVVAVASLCSLVLRRAPAKHRHTLWVTTLVLSLVLPASRLGQLARTQAHSGRTDQNVEIPFRASVTGSEFQMPNRFHLPHLGPVPVTPAICWTAAACYLVFLLYRIGRFAWAWRHTVTLRRNAVRLSTTDDLQTIVERWSSALGLRRTPPAFLTESVGPVTIGAFRPLLLVPATFAESATQAELVLAIGHELAHIRRRDFQLNLVCEVISLPISFHPAVMFIKSRIARTRELACDDMAAEKLTSRATYAQSLLSIAASLCATAPVCSYGQGLFDAGRMEERIMNLVGNGSRVGNLRGRIFTVASLAILAAASLCASTVTLQVVQPVTTSAIGQAVARPATRPMPLDTPGGTRTIAIRNLTLVGGEELPDAQSLLADELKARAYDAKTVVEEIGERSRMFYQSRGYFKVQVAQPEWKPVGEDTIDVTIHITAGALYHLTDIQFSGNKTFTQEQLRPLYPMQPGDIFTTSAVRTGLEAMRKLYVSAGYRDMTCIPETVFDDSNGTISLKIDVDEGSSSTVNTSGHASPH